ncbi:MAG: hypothetical protein KGD65_16525 [Candidatus Lokiarchaeota archaeon]|nr:hypothetical protein [Candidatus Lokiarchaeota archaeon]
MKNTGLEPQKARYEALRLVQLMEFEMKADPGMEEPLFSVVCDYNDNKLKKTKERINYEF